MFKLRVKQGWKLRDREWSCALSYLNRQDRRATILEAAAGVVMKDGLSAATVRRVAQELGAATGQIHHHFASAAHLRAEALAVLAQRSLASQLQKGEGLGRRERLALALDYSDQATGASEKNLWHEASILADREEPMKAAYIAAIKDWHATIMTILSEGREGADASIRRRVCDSAWRLIGLICGFDELTPLGAFDLSQDDLNRIMMVAIDRELAELELGPAGDSSCRD